MLNLKNHLQNIFTNTSDFGLRLSNFSEGFSLCIRAAIRITFWLLVGFAACCAAYVVLRLVITATNHILKIAGI